MKTVKINQRMKGKTSVYWRISLRRWTFEHRSFSPLFFPLAFSYFFPRCLRLASSCALFVSYFSRCCHATLSLDLGSIRGRRATMFGVSEALEDIVCHWKQSPQDIDGGGCSLTHWYVSEKWGSCVQFFERRNRGAHLTIVFGSSRSVWSQILVLNGSFRTV